MNPQTEEGAFIETEHYPPDAPLHKPMDGRSRFPSDCATLPCDDTVRNISLTAHVLISLEVTAKNLQVRGLANSTRYFKSQSSIGQFDACPLWEQSIFPTH